MELRNRNRVWPGLLEKKQLIPREMGCGTFMKSCLHPPVLLFLPPLIPPSNLKDDLS